jgi:hypothetical protein
MVALGCNINLLKRLNSETKVSGAQESPITKRVSKWMPGRSPDLQTNAAQHVCLVFGTYKMSLHIKIPWPMDMPSTGKPNVLKRSMFSYLIARICVQCCHQHSTSCALTYGPLAIDMKTPLTYKYFSEVASSCLDTLHWLFFGECKILYNTIPKIDTAVLGFLGTHCDHSNEYACNNRGIVGESTRNTTGAVGNSVFYAVRAKAI